jgi:hypothetical protein
VAALEDFGFGGALRVSGPYVYGENLQSCFHWLYLAMGFIVEGIVWKIAPRCKTYYISLSYDRAGGWCTVPFLVASFFKNVFFLYLVVV